MLHDQSNSSLKFEIQFMRGTKTERDRKLAKLIRAYKAAYDALNPPTPPLLPEVFITIDRVVTVNNVTHPYDQVAHYIEISNPISVRTCFSRREADSSRACRETKEYKLLD